MQIHQLKLKTAAQTKKRIGRGGKRGTYSGHGGKGQTARSGRNFRPIIREVLKRYPKLRGYKNHSVGIEPTVVNVKTLQKMFQEGVIISPRTLVEKNIVARVQGKYPQIKILGTGEVTRKLIIRDCAVSKSAKEKIEKVGGSIQ
jgi:large subunit ribosomal protein L15